MKMKNVKSRIGIPAVHIIQTLIITIIIWVSINTLETLLDTRSIEKSSIQSITTTIGLFCLTAVILTSLVVGITKLVSRIANFILQTDTLDNQSYHPVGYYLFPDTEDIRRQLFRNAPRYNEAYTVLIRITYAEAYNILNTMYDHKTQCYGFVKSFLMPDQICWLHPRISKRAILRVLDDLDALDSDNASAVLVYKYRFPSSNSIANFDDAIFIEANLGRPTYTAAGVTIRSDFARASAPQSSAPPQPEQE